MIHRLRNLAMLASVLALGAMQLVSDPAGAATGGRHPLVGTSSSKPARAPAPR
jgi:hypothetical protein